LAFRINYREAEEIFEVLHLMHEDVKINKLRSAYECPKLRKLLAAWILLSKGNSENPIKKSAFLAYYISECQGSNSGED
jgi:hypothetical protein